MTYTADEMHLRALWLENFAKGHGNAPELREAAAMLRQAADGRREGVTAEVVERVNDIIVAMVRTDDENVYGARAAAKRIAELFPASGAAVQVPERDVVLQAVRQSMPSGNNFWALCDQVTDRIMAALAAGQQKQGA